MRRDTRIAFGLLVAFCALWIVLCSTTTLKSQSLTTQFVASFTTGSQAATAGTNTIGSGSQFYTMTWSVSGSVTACSIALDSAPDGTTWTGGGVIPTQTCTSNGTITSAQKLVNFVRLNPNATITGTGSVVVNVTATATASGAGNTAFATTASAGAGAFSIVAVGLTKVWGLYSPVSITTSSVNYNVSTADNTADVYDIGLYDNSGNLVVHTGALAGTVLFPATGNTNHAWISSGTVPAGRYYFAATCSVGCTAVIGGANLGSFAISQAGPAPVSNALVAGAMPSDSFSFGVVPTLIFH